MLEQLLVLHGAVKLPVMRHEQFAEVQLAGGLLEFVRRQRSAGGELQVLPLQ